MSASSPSLLIGVDRVPFIVTGDKGGLEVSDEPGALADVAPTVLAILGIPQPKGKSSSRAGADAAEMSGRSLLSSK